MRRRVQDFGWGLAALLAVVVTLPARATDTVVYYHTDALRSVAVVTNASGAVIERTHYAPYGQVLNRPLRDGPGYAGHREDAATGLVYMQQRYYDPESGRFLSADPVGVDLASGGNFNRYWYANNNPYRYTDPTGMCTGTHICNPDGTAVSSGDFTTQPRDAHLPGASAAQRGAILGLREPSQSRPTTSVGQPQQVMLARNSDSDSSVKLDEARNAADAFGKEYAKLMKLGVFRTSATELFVGLLARGVNAANTTYDAGMIAAGGARITFVSANLDIRRYIFGGRLPGPTSAGYPGSWVQWGRDVSWRPFDPGLDNSQEQIWANFLIGAGMYSKSGEQ